MEVTTRIILVQSEKKVDALIREMAATLDLLFKYWFLFSCPEKCFPWNLKKLLTRWVTSEEAYPSN